MSNFTPKTATSSRNSAAIIGVFITGLLGWAYTNLSKTGAIWEMPQELLLSGAAVVQIVINWLFAKFKLDSDEPEEPPTTDISK